MQIARLARSFAVVLLTSVCYYEITPRVARRDPPALCSFAGWCNGRSTELHSGPCIHYTRPFAPGVQSANFVTRPRRNARARWETIPRTLKRTTLQRGSAFLNIPTRLYELRSIRIVKPVAVVTPHPTDCRICD